MTVSICIPTYRRPEMLRECIESCFANSTRPIEIVVSDDDPNSETFDAINSLAYPDGITLVYTHNLYGKGQAANVNSAFRTASHERLVLMHDDDFLLPHGIDHLANNWNSCEQTVAAVYGFQAIVTNDNKFDKAATEANNFAYFRHNDELWKQRSALRSALLGQFPNNGYMIRRSIALNTGYPSEDEVGRIPVDHHFGIRYALNSAGEFLLIPEMISAYRISEVSVARSRKTFLRPVVEDAHLGWKALKAVDVRSSQEQEALDLALRRVAKAAIESSIYTGNLSVTAEIIRHSSTRWPTSLKDPVRAILSLFAGVGHRAMKRATG